MTRVGDHDLTELIDISYRGGDSLRQTDNKMQSYAVVVLVAATVFGHGHARATSGVFVTAELNNEVAAPECRYKAVPDTIFTVQFVMINKLKQCIEPSAAFDHLLGNSPDVDAYRRLFGSACTQAPSAKACIAAVDADASSCLNQVERKLWTTILDFLDMCITETCANDGEVMATMFGDEFNAMTMGNKHRVVSCMHAASVQTMFDRETDLPAYTLRKYRGIKSGRQCILNVAKQGETSANIFEQFMDKLIRSMKCLTPVTNEIVSCEMLEAERAIDNYDD